MYISRVIVLLFVVLTLTSSLFAQESGKPPIIVIPGVTGSNLVNASGKTVWFSLKRDKEDDIRLPMTSAILAANRDSLRSTDIIRKVEVPILPDVEVYQSLVDELRERGYTEAKWDKPVATDVFYVFGYDWRRDNVEAARLLVRRMTAAKRTLRKPDLKFDILAHSMGGLIARYAAMYGGAEPSARPSPSWAGAAHIRKLLLFGTPNEGSMNSFEALLTGYPIVADRKLPFIDDLRPEDVMTNPSAFQLLPHQPSVRFLDEDLNPMQVDLYNIDTWLKYRWGALSDPKFLGKLRDAKQLAKKDPSIKPERVKKGASADDVLISKTTYAQVKAYFRSALERARRFNLALNVPVTKMPIEVHAYGGNCNDTLDAAILVRDEKKNEWTTILSSRDFKRSDGIEVKKDTVKGVIYALGDGRVTQRSLLAESSTDGKPEFPKIDFKTTFFACGTHTRLFLDQPIRESFLSALVMEQAIQP